ncbi:LOW QUALITY PROTEIN: uncharacterized protein ACIGJ3_015892 [Trichechus inunguis]
MEAPNQSAVKDFVLLGLSAHPKLEKTFFVLILLMYLVILLGNGVLILVTVSDSRLHTPMYFFLRNLSFLDICYTTSSVPLVLDGFLTPRKTISFSGCAVQMFLSFAMGATECVLLGMMAFDRYVSICNPLRYPVIMSKAAYVPMAASSWLAGGTNSLVQISLAVQLPFCGDNIINHFICEILAVLKLACADISINVVSMGVANVIFLGVPVLFIFVSYIFIITTILKIPLAEGRRKAFSTCSAHFTVVIIFYGTILFMYGKPKSKDPLGADKQDLSDKLISLFYGLLTPMLNPIIYSLRNKDVKMAVKNMVAQKCFTQKFKMEMASQSAVKEFVLLGLSDQPRLEKTFFVLILLMYLVILLGNGVLILVTVFDSHLHTPMYFFLGNLSFLDICYTTSSIPLVLDGFLTPRKTISFSGCAVQMFLSFAMGAKECVLLGMMAFDRYVAICNPLRYPVIMSKAAYVPMAASSLAGGTNSLVQISLEVQLPFCGDNVINHFACEILAVLKLACADISTNVISMGVANVIFLGVPVLFIFVSYIFILTTILRIPSAEGRQKALSTCSAHLTVVVIFYGTILFMYAKPKSKDPLRADRKDVSDKLISLFYGVLTPMLNPIIYSLRNKDVKVAVKNLVSQKFFAQ